MCDAIRQWIPIIDNITGDRGKMWSHWGHMYNVQENRSTQQNTTWCQRWWWGCTNPGYAGIVAAPNKPDDVRICVDLKSLNDGGVLRETYPIPLIDGSLTWLEGAMIFSKVDANSGFLPKSYCLRIPNSWQPSLLSLTTLVSANCPWGSLVPPSYIYQCWIRQILSGLGSVLCHTGVLIYSSWTWCLAEYSPVMLSAASHTQC